MVVTQRLQVNGGDGPALPDNAAAPPGGAARVGHQPDQAGRNRARVFNFGPLRVGFGAGGGNLIDDLAQRIHNGEARPPADLPGNAGGQQHFGFGFGFGRRPNPRNQSTPASSNTPIQAQLDQIERSLQQQINSLRVASNELHLVRMLNNELVRLRTLQAATGSANNEAVLPQMPNTPLGPMQALDPNQLPPVAHQPTATLPTVLSSRQQPILSSESDALPEGVTLPPGWTLLPLQRSDGASRNVMNGSGATTTQAGTTSVPVPVQTTDSPPPRQPSTDLSDPFPSRTRPPGAAANIAQQVPSSLSPAAIHQRNSTLPSWGSAPYRVNGDSADEGRELAVPMTNGEATPGAAAKSADSATKVKEKGKGRAATGEDLVDDVD